MSPRKLITNLDVATIQKCISVTNDLCNLFGFFYVNANFHREKRARVSLFVQFNKFLICEASATVSTI